MVELAIVSNSLVIRAGLRAVLETAGADICLEAEACSAAVGQIHDSNCGGVFLDLSSESAALEVCQALSSQEDAPPVTGVDCLPRAFGSVQHFLGAGMQGYVSVGRNVAAFLRAVEAAERGETVIFLESGPEGSGLQNLDRQTRAPVLDETDRRIFEELGGGLKDWEVAEKLDYSESTVRHRVEKAEHRYESCSRFQLACRLIGSGQLQPAPWQPTREVVRGRRRRT